MNRMVLIVILFVSAAFAQTQELINMPLGELQAKVDHGDAPAMVQLSVRNNLGIGVGQNLKLTRELIEKAARAGNITAIGICAV